MKIMFAIILLLLAASNSIAGSGSGHILQLMTHYSSDGNGVVFFRTEQNANQASSNTSEWSISLATGQGKAMFSMLLSAQAQNKPIHVMGFNDCRFWPDREAVAYIYINS